MGNDEHDPRRNPYVGPRSFRRRDAELFFGRDEEARRLRQMLTSEELVLFYAPSGAGKTSLLNARLVLDLEDDGFFVLPAARVGGQSRLGVEAANVYVFNVLTSLSPSFEQTARAAELAEQTLAAFLARQFPRRGDELRVLILDQFEEILTTHPQRRADREGFFRQLRQALETDPSLSVLLAMREDMIAGLDEYAPLVRNQLRARLRMDRLSRDDALKAIAAPARLAGRPFAPGVAEEVVGKLSAERVAGREEPVPGRFVEPMQLQIVGHQLWDDVAASSASAAQITREHLERFGDLDQALERYYDQAVAATARGAEALEEELRLWIERALITPPHLRAQVPFDPRVATEGGLPAAAVQELIRAHHLIRPVDARGGTWLELVHDTFVDPIRLSNARWLARESPLAAAAQALERGEPGYLDRYPDERLDADEARAEVRLHLVSVAERRVLKAARKRRRMRFLRIAASAATLVLLAAAALVALWRQNAGTLQRIFVAREELAAGSPRASLETTLAAARRFLAPSTFGHELRGLLREGIYACRSRPLWAHPGAGAVGSFAWSADERRLASADGKGTVTVWAAGTGEVVARHDAAALAPVRWLAADGEGGRFAVFGAGGARLWTTADDRVVELAGVPESVDGAAFSPDGALLAAVDHAAGLRLWRTDGGAPGTLAASVEGAFLSLAWSADGPLALGDTGGQVRLARLEAGGDVLLAEPFAAHTAAVPLLVFSADGDALASADTEHGFRLWDARTWQDTSLRHDQTVVDAAFSVDGHYLLTLDRADQVHVWNRHHRALVDRFPAVRSQSPASGEQPVPGGLARGGRRLARRGLEVLELFIEAVPAHAGHEDEVRAVAFDGRLLATAGGDGTVRLWEPGGRPRLFTGHEGDVRCVALSGDGRWLASGGNDRTVRLWDAASGRLVHTFGGHAAPVRAVAFGAGGLTSADLRGAVRTWDVASGQLAREWPQAGTFTAIAASPEGESLVTVDDGGVAVVWDSAAAAARLRLAVTGENGHEGRLSAVALGPHGRRLATAGEDLAIRVWDAGSGRELIEPAQPAYRARVTALAFSPDGRLLAAADADRILVWDAVTGDLTDRVPARWRAVEAVALSSDGRLLASAGGDGLAHLDPLDLGGLTDLARRRLAIAEERP
ncbi:MAG TPA: hypothetical protein VGC93_18235 [Thermoanaerobaculia bacterium]